jgi:hypothetical protein
LVIRAEVSGPTPWKTFSFASTLDPQVSMAQVCNNASASPSRGFCWGIHNQVFRTLNREIISVSQVRLKRLSCETPEALKSFFIFQNPSFDRYPSSPAEQSNKSKGSRFPGHSRMGCFSSRRSPKGEILLTQPVTAWVSLRGFRLP